MPNLKCEIPNLKFARRGFTLMELLIVMLIIAVLAALALTALQGAAEDARATRTRAIIAKLDQLLMERYNAYRTRALPIRVAPGTVPKSEPFTDANANGFWDGGETFTDRNGSGAYNYGAAYFRLMAMRELMRMELPDRRTDIVFLSTGVMEPTYTGMTQAALQRTYYRKIVNATGTAADVTQIQNKWSLSYQGAECLYLIVSTMHDGDKNALDFFMPRETGDVDGDGMREILDGWGNPIEFLRWAPAYTTGNGVLTMQVAPGVTAAASPVPDPYDPVREDARMTFALHPLIYSAGRDKSYDIAAQLVDGSGNDFRYTLNRNDPYYVPTIAGQFPLGTPTDTNGNGYPEWADNITNHYQPTNGP
jgi:prepilin-type N-terminal cleavage/methylation domain-containing protein